MAKKPKLGNELAQSTPSGPKLDPVNPENDYETQGHLDALMKAHSIMNDPAKMLKVHALAGRHKKAIKSIQSIQDIKNAYHEKFGKKAGLGALKEPKGAEPDGNDQE